MASWAALAAASLLMPLLARAEEPAAAAAERVATADGGIALRVPAAWNARRRENDKVAMELRIESAGGNGRGMVQVFDTPEAGADPWQQAAYETAFRAKESDTRDVEMRAAPVAHVVTRYTDPQPTALVRAYRCIKSRRVQLHLHCRPDELAELLPEFLEVARTVETERFRGTPLPENFRIVDRGGWRFRLHPKVNEAAAKDVMALLAKVRNWFEKAHGAIPKESGEPPTAILYDALTSAVPFCARAGEATQGTFLEEAAGRLHAVPPPGRSTNETTVLAASAWRLLFDRRYPGEPVAFVRYGEGWLAGLRARWDVKLPEVTEGTYNGFIKRVRPLDKLAADDGSKEFGDYIWECAGYAAYFTAGPASKRAAYRRFLADFAKSGNGRAAAEMHLLAGDLPKLREEVDTFLRKLPIVADPKR